MEFHVVLSYSLIPPVVGPRAYLIHNEWNDWFKYQTHYSVVFIDAAGKRHDIGGVKIGSRGLQGSSEAGPNARIPAVPPNFTELPEGFFSLGEGENYYETLNTLGAGLRREILIALKDCAYDLNRFDEERYQLVMIDSLLRSHTDSTVRKRLHRLANGNAVLTPYGFDFIMPPSAPTSAAFEPDSSLERPREVLSFKVEPESSPPTNVHVIIGRNGVGKSRCLKSIANTVLQIDDEDAPRGTLNHAATAESAEFAGLVFVSFSAFESFDLPPQVPSGIRAAQIGIRHRDPDTKQVSVRTPEQLASDFADSFGKCRTGLRSDRWRSALATLDYDTLFHELGISRLLDYADGQWREVSIKLFKRLSSGHAIVLMAVTRLVELVDERTLVLLDEPEGHLHPPLLSAFIRALADLLGRRNGVALIATHSPVVLQEAPAQCCWMLSRSGRETRAARPPIETFGENVSVLTREVFKLELTNTGFHTLIRQAVDSGRTYEEVVAHFRGQLGAEGRALARTMVLERENKDQA
ncbi:ATP-dependent nuclease [Achromobacter insolitus]|uniref:ATP-dependent nuclease n=1 Tax=Achromobacter insolitus TaxID=217204 RepID=UPI00174BF9B9|nr:AAA family ATPase [Achromobacter insolitus]